MGSVLLLLSLALGSPLQVDRAERLAAAERLLKSGDTSGAVKAYRALLPEVSSDDVTRATVLEQLAAAETHAAEYAEAAKHAEAAAQIYATRGDDRRRGVALNTAGVALLYAGDYSNAEAKILAAREHSVRAGDRPAQAEQLTNLGNLRFFVGRYTDAEDAYQAVLALCDAHPSDTWSPRRRRLVQVNRATLYQRLGRDQQALEIYQELEGDANTLPPREQAQILTNLGVLYRRLGDPHKALTVYDEARGLFARDQQVDGELAVMKNRGIALALDLGELPAAGAVFSESLAKATKAGNRREMLQARLYRGEVHLRLGQHAAAEEDFAAALDLARALGTREEQWKALYGLGRLDIRAGWKPDAAAHLEEAVAVVESIRESVRVPSMRSDFFTDKREVYDALIASLIDRVPAERVFDLIERSHSRAWRERLGLSGAVTLSSVQQALAPEAILIDFWHSPLGSAAVVVTRDGAEVVRVTPAARDIEQLSAILAGVPSPSWRGHAEALAAALPIPIAQGIREVIIVPDGALALVPFEVLPIGGRPLAERVATSYAPTAAILLRPAPAARRFAPPWRVQLQAFGDPEFASASLDDVDLARARMQGTREEIQAIQRQITGRADVHLGGDNRKDYLRSAASRAPLLHIASHAVADVNAMEQSRILFAPHPGSANADYLFLREAYDLDLKGVELAVLSACETERGRVLRGEGVQSFSRAFLAAGARSTVTTLWRVPDRPTAAFMAIFYHHLQRGVSRAEALRLAKMRFADSGTEWSHPHYWAAFVLSGEGTLPISRAMGWAPIVTTATALLLVAVAVIVRKRILRAERPGVRVSGPPVY